MSLFPGTVHEARRVAERTPAAVMWALFYIALALVVTWPVPAVLTTRLPHDLGDPVMSATLRRWNATVPIFSQRWWNGVGFYPLLDTLALSDTRLGMSLISTPVFWLTGSNRRLQCLVHPFFCVLRHIPCSHPESYSFVSSPIEPPSLATMSRDVRKSSAVAPISYGW